MKFNCCKTKKSQIKLKKVVDFLKIISEENRLKILCILQKQEKCVCDIWQFLDLPQNLISHHLKVLKDFGLIGSRKEGTKVFYFLNRKNIKKFTSLFSHFRGKMVSTRKMVSTLFFDAKQKVEELIKK